MISINYMMYGLIIMYGYTTRAAPNCHRKYYIIINEWIQCSKNLIKLQRFIDYQEW